MAEQPETIIPADVRELADVAPEQRRFVLLSGLGFYRLWKERKRQLRIALSASAGVFVLVLAALGGWIIMTSRAEKATVFTTPPPVRSYEPRKLEHKVKVQKRQRSSSRPAILPRLVSTRPAEVSLPDIKMDPKLVNTTFQPNFRAVSGKGLGAGLGTGYGTHGFGEGISNIDFFGIRARGERVAVLVDVSVSMVEEERGGVEGFLRVKERLSQVVDALSEAALFNVVAFGDAASQKWNELVIANGSNKKDAKLFMQPFNMEGNWGLDTGNVAAISVGLAAQGGTTRLDLALTAAFMQGADTILVISDGLPKVQKAVSAEQIQAWNQKRDAWQRENAARVQAWSQAEAAAEVVEERVWVPPQPARPARAPSKAPPKEGQAPDRGSPAQPAQEGRWQVVHHRVGGGGGNRPQPPAAPEPGYWTLADFVEHLNLLYKKVYEPKGRKMPVIHCIGYQIDNDGHAFLQGLAKQFHGQYRRVARLR